VGTWLPKGPSTCADITRMEWQKFQWVIVAGIVAVALIAMAFILRPHQASVVQPVAPGFNTGVSQGVTPEVACLQGGGTWNGPSPYGNWCVH